MPNTDETASTGPVEKLANPRRRTGCQDASPLRRLVGHVHFVFAALLGVVFFLFFSGLTLLVALLPPWRYEAAVIFGRLFGFSMRMVLGWRFDTRHAERFHDIRPAIFVANHQSNLDLAIYGSIFPVRTAAIGKKEIRNLPLFGWLFTRSGNILIDRSNPATAIASLEAVGRQMHAENLDVWMFPEGHRNQGERLLPFKRGAFHLAASSGIPLVPVVCEPIGRVLDVQRLYVSPGTLRIEVLPPVETTGHTALDLSARVTEIMQAEVDRLGLLAKDRKAARLQD